MNVLITIRQRKTIIYQSGCGPSNYVNSSNFDERHPQQMESRKVRPRTAPTALKKPAVIEVTIRSL